MRNRKPTHDRTVAAPNDRPLISEHFGCKRFQLGSGGGFLQQHNIWVPGKGVTHGHVTARTAIQGDDSQPRSIPLIQRPRRQWADPTTCETAALFDEEQSRDEPDQYTREDHAPSFSVTGKPDGDNARNPPCPPWAKVKHRQCVRLPLPIHHSEKPKNRRRHEAQPTAIWPTEFTLGALRRFGLRLHSHPQLIAAIGLL